MAHFLKKKTFKKLPNISLKWPNFAKSGQTVSNWAIDDFDIFGNHVF